jgi:hypothetical protein
MFNELGAFGEACTGLLGAQAHLVDLNNHTAEQVYALVCAHPAASISVDG